MGTQRGEEGGGGRGRTEKGTERRRGERKTDPRSNALGGTLQDHSEGMARGYQQLARTKTPPKRLFLGCMNPLSVSHILPPSWYRKSVTILRRSQVRVTLRRIPFVRRWECVIYSRAHKTNVARDLPEFNGTATKEQGVILGDFLEESQPNSALSCL